MSASGSVDRLLSHLVYLSISPRMCKSCSQLPKQQYIRHQFGTMRRLTALSHILIPDTHSPFLLRSYSASSPFILFTARSRVQRTKISYLTGTSSRSLCTDQAKNHSHPNQRDATTSIAMIYCAQQNHPDQCLQHYLRLLSSQGKLPSHEALHQLARVLYKNQHLTGFSILHDTLLAYYTIHPLSVRQSRNLTYIYTMFINLIIRRPRNINKRYSSTSKKQPTPIPPSAQSRTLLASPSSQQIITATFSSMSSSTSSPYFSSLMDILHPSQTTTEKSPATTIMDGKTATIIQLCQEMRQLGLTGTSTFYNSLLKFCVMKQDVDLAWNFFNELASTCTPTRHTFSILLDLTRQQKDLSGTLLVLDRMDQTGILPDRAMTSTVMLTLCDQHLYTDAADLVDRLAQQCPQLVGPIYRSILMDTLYRHYCQHGPHTGR